MNRRQLLAGSFPAALRLGAKSPPNVLVFMTDQESALLPGPASLPHRQRLLDRGVRFTHAFCNTPQCSPARAALLTGLEPHRAGVLTNVDESSLGKALAPSTPTVGSFFRKAGYSTGYFGKWHLSKGGGKPDSFGFSTSHAGSDEECVEAASQWMRSQSGPWLAWVSVLDPHHIYDIPRRLASVKPRPGVRPPFTGLDNLRGKPAEQRAFVDQDQGQQTRQFTPEDWIRYRSFYLDLVEKTDALLGKSLDAAGALDNTVVACTTDHGDALGEHGLSYKGPSLYDELIRIPLVLAAPGLQRQQRHDLVRQTDLAPTLASLAGLRWDVPGDGRDLTRDRKGPDAVFLEYYSKQKWVNPIRTIRTRQWKLNWYNSGHKELYDLSQDPNEVRNLAGSGHPMQARLEARISAWRGPIS